MLENKLAERISICFIYGIFEVRIILSWHKMADLIKKENEVVKEYGFSEGQMAKNKSWLGKGKQ